MDLKLPPLGEGVDSGTVVSILVKEGEDVAKGQGMIELETGKAVAPVPAPSPGKVVKLLVSVGDKISVGQAILSIEASGGAAPAPAKPAAPKPAAAPARPARQAAPPPDVEEESPGEVENADTSGPEPAASPTIRHMARELGINLRKISGSEAGGRIVMADVRAYIQRLQKLAAAKAGAGAAKPAAPPLADFSKWGPIAKRPMSPLRKVIAERMGQSWSAVPRVTQFEEPDITALDAMRKQYANSFEKKGGRLTLTVLILKVVADTLKKHPGFNATIDEAAGEIIFKEYFHIGMAVDTEQGLIVPVLRDVDKKDLLTLARELHDLAGRTRDRKVAMEELQGGTFTISNQGGIGGGMFTPVVNLPEVAILGLGRGALKPVVREGKIEPRLLLPAALSYDHRANDGGSAARFMIDLARGLETFDEKLCQI